MYVANDWDKMFDAGVGSTHNVSPLSNTVQAKVVEVHSRNRDPYGEAYQDDDEPYIIFEVDGRFFKKTGYESSYSEDDRSWEGDVTEVFGTTKTVTVFVPKGSR